MSEEEKIILEHKISIYKNKLKVYNELILEATKFEKEHNPEEFVEYFKKEFEPLGTTILSSNYE